MFDNLEFVGDDELRKPLPPGTVANVAVRANKDGEYEFKSGESQYGKWLAIPLEVVDGEHKGEWASMMVNVDPRNRRFRQLVGIVTGLDLSAGGVKLDWESFKEKLITGVFEAQLGPEERKNRQTGEREQTGFTACFKFVRRVGDRDPFGQQAAAAVPAIGEEEPAPIADDDLPF